MVSMITDEELKRGVRQYAYENLVTRLSGSRKTRFIKALEEFVAECCLESVLALIQHGRIYVEGVGDIIFGYTDLEEFLSILIPGSSALPCEDDAVAEEYCEAKNTA